MHWLEALILGIVQGLTEFLPVSSTAHLRIVPALLGLDDPGAAFTAVIQIGTLVAVFVYFRKDIARIGKATVADLLAGTPLRSDDAKMGWMIVVGTVPIVVAGLVFKESIVTTLRSLWIISSSLIGLCLVLVVAEALVRRRLQKGESLRRLDELGWRDAILVGLCRPWLIPGTSRSGVTIAGGLFLGMDRETAARFSFLLSLPSIFAAGVYELVSEREALLSSTDDLTALVIATVVSGVVGYGCIMFLLDFLKRHSTWLFIVYRIVLGVLLLGLLAAGKLEAVSAGP